MPKSRKPFLRRILELRLFLVVNLLILFLLTLSFGREFVRNFEIQKDIERLQAQAEELEVTNLQISQLNTAFQTESFIEREARLKLGMKKPGEQVVVIQQEEETETGDDTLREDENPLNILAEDAEELESVANPTKWWYYFFDRSQFNQYVTYE